MKYLGLLKKHYEKILLAVVLLFLVIAVAMLPILIANERAALEEERGKITSTPPKPLTNLDLSFGWAALERTKLSPRLVFSDPKHNLFSPVKWLKTPDGRWVRWEKATEGPELVEVAKITPLYLAVTLESISASTTNYLIKVVKETEPTTSKRITSRYLAVGGKTDQVVLREVKGPPEKPTELVLEIVETGERVTITPEQGFRRVDGYAVDLRYPPERRFWPNRRKGDTITFANDEFSVTVINPVAAHEFEVVLSARSTGKKTSIRYKVPE